MEKPFDLKNLMRNFRIYGTPMSCAPYGNGHINDTYEVIFDQSGKLVRYILQRINCNIFRDPVGLMENIQRVTAHLSSRNADSRSSLTLIPTQDGQCFYMDENNNCFRCYLFIENATSFDILENPRQAYEAARAFGRFQADLADIPGGRLNETIKDFIVARQFRFCGRTSALEEVFLFFLF